VLRTLADRMSAPPQLPQRGEDFHRQQAPHAWSDASVVSRSRSIRRPTNTTQVRHVEIRKSEPNRFRISLNNKRLMRLPKRGRCCRMKSSPRWGERVERDILSASVRSTL